MNDRLDRIITRLEAETGPGPWGTLIKLLVEECRETRKDLRAYKRRLEFLETTAGRVSRAWRGDG